MVSISPGVVIATRNRLVAELSEFGGRPIPAGTRAEIADWLISSGWLAESYFAVGAGIEDDA